MFKPLSTNPTKMVKHTQTVWRQQPTKCLGVFGHSVGLALKSAEATCVEIATEMQKRFRLKDMVNFNVLRNY